MESSLANIQQVFLLSEQAEQALRHYVSIANQYFEQHFPVPSINFKLRGKSAGKALLQLWEIRLNPVLFNENQQQFLHEVIPHELAHLITFALFGRVKPHGKEWKMVMERVFSLAAKTTHTFEITSVQGRTYEYKCHCDIYALTIRRHNKAQKGQARYHCRQCRQELIYTGIQLT